MQTATVSDDRDGERAPIEVKVPSPGLCGKALAKAKKWLEQTRGKEAN